MTDKVRVRNVSTYDIGIRAINGIEHNIKAGLFIPMNRDDVEYNMALAPKLFEAPPQLIVEDEELNNIMGVDVASEICDKAVAEKYLKGAANKLKAWLTENNKPNVLEVVFKTAKEMDLPASKIKILQEFMPNRDFMGE